MKNKLDIGTSKFESGACDLRQKGRTTTRKKNPIFGYEGESRMLPGCSQSDLRMIPEIAQKWHPSDLGSDGWEASDAAHGWDASDAAHGWDAQILHMVEMLQMFHMHGAQHPGDSK